MDEKTFNYWFEEETDDDDAIFEDNGEDMAHYGTPRHSGRYPWGSGKNPQHGLDFIAKADKYKAKGYTDAQIAKAMKFKSTKAYKAERSQAHAARAADELRTVNALMKRYNGNVSAVARAMGRNESSIRSILKPKTERQTTIMNSTMSVVRDEMKRLDGEYLDVGKGSNLAIGVTQSRLDMAVKALEKEGYVVHSVRQEQMNGSGNSTQLKILCPKGTQWSDVLHHKERIHTLAESGKEIDKGTGKPTTKIVDPVSISSKRVYVRYTDDKGKGGVEKDGTIEIREGVPDMNLGNARYAQVRILVDGNKYMKGMAYYSKDVPKGYDCIYNTNKTTDKADKVFKEIDEKYKTDDFRPIDRFGAVIDHQNKYTDPKTGKEKTGCLNIVREEGDWNNWSDNLASQFLSKQKVPVAKQQLNIDYTRRAEELETISKLTNPVLKQALLKPFADECDSAAVDLKAAAFPRQGWHVILPNPKLKENEIYAPNYKDGEKVILIRYPHGGTFEIPQLTVNNGSRSSKDMIGNNAKDAVVINKKVADRLSGADFDGDTVLVIPNNQGKLISKPALEGLKNFDTKESYPPIEGGKKAVVGTPKNSSEYHWPEQLQMGMVSNLITDMTNAGAPSDEICRAVKHSMVVIDVKKHNLDWQRSERENGIQELRNKYQAKEDPTKPGGGASSLMSRASSEIRDIPDRKPAWNKKDENGNYIIKDGINVKTGEKEYQLTNKTLYREGKEIPRTITSTRMYEAKDARSLMSGPHHEGTEMERVYATYANQCKALGNKARKEYVSVKLPKKDPAAAKEYAAEVASLKNKLQLAQQNIPLERMAHIKAGLKIKAMRENGVTMSASDWKKEKGKALTRARRDIGASRYDIKIEPREWEAIQKNAVSPTTLRAIFDKTDLDSLKKMAMPKEAPVLTTAKIARIKAYSNAGMTQADIAETLGISTSSVRDALKK